MSGLHIWPNLIMQSRLSLSTVASPVNSSCGYKTARQPFLVQTIIFHSKQIFETRPIGLIDAIELEFYSP